MTQLTLTSDLKEVFDLRGCKVLVVGIANEHSLAWSAAEQFRMAGAIRTRAASGIQHFDELPHETASEAPLRRTVDACEAGRAALLLASDYARTITGEILHVDAGLHVEPMVFH